MMPPDCLGGRHALLVGERSHGRDPSQTKKDSCLSFSLGCWNDWSIETQFAHGAAGTAQGRVGRVVADVGHDFTGASSGAAMSFGSMTGL